MSCPVSSPRRLILVEQLLEGAVSAWVVGGVSGPAFPDDGEPGAGEDADGVGVGRGRGRGPWCRGWRSRGWRVGCCRRSQMASRSCLSTAQRKATMRVPRRWSRLDRPASPARTVSGRHRGRRWRLSEARGRDDARRNRHVHEESDMPARRRDPSSASRPCPRRSAEPPARRQPGESGLPTGRGCGKRRSGSLPSWQALNWMS